MDYVGSLSPPALVELGVAEAEILGVPADSDDSTGPHATTHSPIQSGVMTGAIITGVVSLVLGLISTNVLVSRRTRWRKRLREDAELLEHTPPDVANRDHLAHLLGVELLEYVLDGMERRDLNSPKERAKTATIKRVAQVSFGISIVLALAAIASFIASLLGS